MEWHPIETAPKDGTRALVWIDLTGEHVKDRSYARIACWDGDCERWRDGHSGPPLTIDPTHWMPLPAPPLSTNNGRE